MKERNPDLEAVLEKDSDLGAAKHFDKIESKDIIDMAI